MRKGEMKRVQAKTKSGFERQVVSEQGAFLDVSLRLTLQH